MNKSNYDFQNCIIIIGKALGALTRDDYVKDLKGIGVSEDEIKKAIEGLVGIANHFYKDCEPDFITQDDLEDEPVNLFTGKWLSDGENK